MTSRNPPTQADWETWARKPAWSQRELSELCAGLLPGTPNRAPDEQALIEGASETIVRAVTMGALTAVERADVTRAHRFYDNARLFVPAVAATWAARQFPNTFPRQLLAACNAHGAAKDGADGSKPLGTTERNSLLRIIRALDVMAKLPERGAATSVALQARQLGFSTTDDTIRKAITAARSLEPDEKPNSES